jgi:hypothetical protein
MNQIKNLMSGKIGIYLINVKCTEALGQHSWVSNIVDGV